MEVQHTMILDRVRMSAWRAMASGWCAGEAVFSLLPPTESYIFLNRLFQRDIGDTTGAVETALAGGCLSSRISHTVGERA